MFVVLQTTNGMGRLIFSIALILFSTKCVFGQYVGVDITVKSMYGNVSPLSNYINQDENHVTLFVFWKTCCPMNLRMIDSLISLTEGNTGVENLTVILVSVDDTRSTNMVMPLVRMKGWEADVILDVNMDLARAMSVCVPPQWVAVNSEGKPFYRRKIMEGESDVEYYFNELITMIEE